MPTSYLTTSVPVERSKEAIRKLLIAFGARGVQFSENFDTREINIRFAKDSEGSLRTVNVTMIVPEPPQSKRPRKKRGYRYSRGRMVYDKTPRQRMEQMERATYRALHYWLKSQFEAVEFGLLSFEDVFLSHFEQVVGGKRMTIGSMIKPRLAAGGLLLSAPADDDNIIEGERA